MSAAKRLLEPVRLATLIVVIAAVSPIVTVQTAATVVPQSTAARHTVTTTGAVLVGVGFTVDGDGTTVTGAEISLRGNQTLNQVSVRYATGAAIECGIGSYTIGIPGSTKFNCGGLSQSAAKSTAFTITVSPRA